MGATEKSGTTAGRIEPRDVAAYVASLSQDLSVLSRRNGMPTLAYLLDMARLEADTLARNAGSEPLGPGLDLP